MKQQKDHAYYEINMSESINQSESIEKTSQLALDYLGRTASYLLESLDKKILVDEEESEKITSTKSIESQNKIREDLRNNHEKKREGIQRKWKRY